MPALPPIVLEVLVFIILLFVLVLTWFATVSIIKYRRRRACVRALQAQPQQSVVLAAEFDVEKGVSTADELQTAVDGSPRRHLGFLAPVAAFLRWRQRVLYESDSLQELAVLPWFRREESSCQKILNFVLRKNPAKAEPPTIASVRRAVEAHDASLSGDCPSIPPTLPQIPRIPEIVVHCVCERERFAIVEPEECPSCSCPRSRSPSPSSSLPAPEPQVANTALGSDPASASPDRSDFPSTSRDSSAMQDASFPPPSSTGVGFQPDKAGGHERADTDGSQGQQLNDGSSSSSGKTKTFIVVVPASGDGEKTPAPQRTKRGSVAHRCQLAAGFLAAGGPLPVLRLGPTFSTTSSLVDLLLEAIAADSDADVTASSDSFSSIMSQRSSRSDDSSDDDYGDDPVSEVLSLYFSDAENRLGSGSSGSGSGCSSDDGTSWRASRSSLTSSADLDAQVRTGWRASLGRIWAAHGVSVTVLST